MLFEMSTETIEKIIAIETMITEKLGSEYSLDFDSENVVEDFFELCALSHDKRIGLEADQVWVRLMRENPEFDKTRALNSYRAKMKTELNKNQSTLVA